MFRKSPQLQSRPGATLLVRQAVVVCASLIGLLASVYACSVPVFRYALERWPADTFEALVYYRGAMPETEAALIAAAEKSNTANLSFRQINLDTETDEELIALWEDEETTALPRLVLTYPKAYPFIGPVASGAVTSDVLEGLAASPQRQYLADRLAGGDTAVWILLESGDEEKDEAIAAALGKRLGQLESTLELPTLEQEDIDAGLTTATQDDLKVEFSIQRLSRDDPAEEIFVEMLLDSEEDLSELDEPIVFPVFGRGRVLYALIGEGIHAGTIDLAAEYIVGACSCQVKEQNPGVDLLMAKDWEPAIGVPQVIDRELPPLEGVGDLLVDPSRDEDVTIEGPSMTVSPISVAKAPAASSGFLGKSIVAAAIFLLLVVSAGTLIILKRNSNN